MDDKSKQTLETILAKDVDSLSEGEVEFLMARRDYLNDADRKRYADLIKAHESGKSAKGGDGLDDMNADDLKALAEKEGVDLKGIRAKKDMVSAIRAARA